MRPSVTDGEYEDALGWCWTAEENHWNWHEQAYYDGPNKCGYLPVDIRPEKYDNATLKAGVVHDVNGHRIDSLRGQALLIIQPQEEKGDVTINVTSPKLQVQGNYTIKMK